MSSVAASIAAVRSSGSCAPSIVERLRRLRGGPGATRRAIDSGELYPEPCCAHLGAVGAWSSHVPKNGAADLRCAIQSIAALGEVCGATAFMAWCQNTLVWYVTNSANARLGSRFAHRVSSGAMLGGTGSVQSHEELLRDRDVQVEGQEGRRRLRRSRRAALGLEPRTDHYFGTIFEREDAPDEIGMFLADCADPAITLQPCKPFLAMDGTGTFGVQFRDVFVPDELILAEQARRSSNASARASSCCRPAWVSA